MIAESLYLVIFQSLHEAYFKGWVSAMQLPKLSWALGQCSPVSVKTYFIYMTLSHLHLVSI